MLNTNDIDENKAQGTREEYRESETATTIIEDLVSRYRAGGQKYGVFIDQAVPPTEITGEKSFAEMAYNELLDGVTYALKAKKDYEAQQSELVAKDDLLTRAQQALQNQHDLIAELSAAVEDAERRAEEAEKNLEMLRFENEKLKTDLEEARADDASSVHRILELEQELSLQASRADSYRNRLAKTQQAYQKAKHAYEVRNAQLNRIPKFLRDRL